MNRKHAILKGAFILTAAGFATRIIGFFYRIFLSHTIGAEGMGIYQLIFPVYAMCYSLTTAGIQTAISRFVSGRMALGDTHGARSVFRKGLLLSLGLALTASLVLHSNAAFIAEVFLQETRCTELLRFLAFAVPFGSIHACVNGYYFGMKRTVVPALSQFFEQIVRVLATYLVYLIFMEKGVEVTPVPAVIGLACSELGAALFVVTVAFFGGGKDVGRRESANAALHDGRLVAGSGVGRHGDARRGGAAGARHAGSDARWHGGAHPASGEFRQILTLSLPLTANRVLINLLQSVEAVLIPLRLRLFGLNTSASLSVYGVLTGMALPLILFPSAITSSVATMLLPTISEAQASGENAQIRRTTETTVRYSLILGILCTGAFLLFGERLGTLLFGNNLAGDFILILAWICPFLYLSTTLASILNGLGKTTTSFLHSAAGLAVRILFVWFAVPHFGIAGYLWGLLASQLLIALLALVVLWKKVHFQFDFTEWLFRPLFALAVSVGIVLFAQMILAKLSWNILPLLEVIVLGLLFCIVYLCITLVKPM